MKTKNFIILIMLIMLASNVFAFQNLIDSVGGEVDPWFRSSGLKLEAINYGNLTLNGNAFFDNLTVTGNFITTNIEDYNVSGSIRLTGCVEYDSGVIDCGVNRTQPTPLKFYGDLNMTGNSITNVHNISGASPITILDDVILDQNIFGDGQGLYNLNLSNSFGGYIDKYGSGNFIGSLYTSGANSQLSDSNALFTVISDTRGTPQFFVQDGGPYQASFITRSFMVVNQNNTLLNSSQNNDCRDWGFLHIDCNTASTGADFGVTDDIEAQGIVYANGGLRAHSTDYGSYMRLGDITGVGQGTNGVYTFSTNVFCDTTFDNFNNIDLDEIWVIVSDYTSEFNEGTAHIVRYLNSSCVELDYNPSWDKDFGPVSYRLNNGLQALVNKGGYVFFNIGDSEDSGFDIHIDNGTSKAAVEIEDIPGADNHRALLIDMDMENYEGLTGLGIHMGTTENQIINKDITMINLEGDASQMNGSTGTFINMQVLGQSLTSDSTMKAFRVPPNLDKIIDVGSVEIVDIVYDVATDITSTIIDQVGVEEIFTNDDDVLYVGADVNFTLVGFQLDDVSSKDIKEDYFYCDNTGTWQELTGISDSTNGFRSSGVVRFPNPTDRGTCNEQLDGTPFADTTNYAYIGIQRTQRKNIDAPTLKFVSISGTGTSMMMSEDLLRLNPVDTAPDTCSLSTLGAIYYDISEDNMCVCKTTGWKVMEDGTACT